MAYSQMFPGRTSGTPELNSSSSQSLSRDSNTELTSELSSSSLDDPSVIVGMACRVPGASSPSQLWQNINDQIDVQSLIPADRFNVNAFYHPKGTNTGTVLLSNYLFGLNYY
jgi:hypothetical protein